MSIAKAKPQNEDLARWVWTLVIVGFFAIQAVIWFVAITLTMSDPSFAVAPQYEQVGENWDALRAQHLASQRLGWSVEFSTVPGEDNSPAQLQIYVRDRQQQPIDGAQIELSLFHCARAAEVQRPTVRAVGDGRYVADANVRRSGFWKLRGTVRRQGQHFLFDQRQRLDVSGEGR